MSRDTKMILRVVLCIVSIPVLWMGCAFLGGLVGTGTLGILTGAVGLWVGLGLTIKTLGDVSSGKI